MNKTLIALAVGFTFSSSVAMAGFNVYKQVGNSSKSETKGYVGLNWSIGKGATPALVLGFMRDKILSSGSTEGANLAFHINLAGGAKSAKIKLSYMHGREDLQGELGVGYSILKSEPLLGFGMNTSYLNLGADWIMGNGFDPNASITSQSKFKKPALACVLDNNSGIGTSNCTPAL
jgi:hypothetical protein